MPYDKHRIEIEGFLASSATIDLREAVRDGYRQARAAAHIGRVHPDLDAQSFSYERFFQVEKALFRLGSEGRSGFSATVAPNLSGNSHHVEIGWGNLLIIASHVAGPGSLPKKAGYRDELVDRQITFWEEEEEARVVLLLTHGGSDQKLEFIRLWMPDGKSWSKIQEWSMSDQIAPRTAMVSEETTIEIELERRKRTVEGEVS